MLQPVLDFEKSSVTENYVDTLPEPIKEAVKAKKAIEGMNRDQVLLAVGQAGPQELVNPRKGPTTKIGFMASLPAA